MLGDLNVSNAARPTVEAEVQRKDGIGSDVAAIDPRVIADAIPFSDAQKTSPLDLVSREFSIRIPEGSHGPLSGRRKSLGASGPKAFSRGKISRSSSDSSLSSPSHSTGSSPRSSTSSTPSGSSALSTRSNSPGISHSSSSSESLDDEAFKKQHRINFIVSVLQSFKIVHREDLIKNLDKILDKVCQNGEIFKTKYSHDECYEMFQEALSCYCHLNAFNISPKREDIFSFKRFLRASRLPGQEPSPPAMDDLTRVTRSYDRLQSSYAKLERTSENLLQIMDGQEFSVCSHVVIGLGDTSTTLWLEKYYGFHGETQLAISQGRISDVLLVGGDFGSWRHDYTLAQPHNILERMSAPANPSDFISQEYYHSNPYMNARHVYQANIVNFAKTDAPVISGTKVVAIEKQVNHLDDWKSKEHRYRLILLTPKGRKVVYTSEIDISTGLGPARNALAGKVISQSDFETLSSYDPKKRFTPIVDGNQFMLTDSEEKSGRPRVIVIYGGGGTAAACYRKAFFDTDTRTEPRPFIDPDKKNNVLWIAARDFSAAGKGKLVTKVLTSTEDRNERFLGELQEITIHPVTGRMKLTFSSPGNSSEALPFISEVECDQLVYSLGQDNIDLKKLCQEFDDELVFDIDETGIPLNIHTNDSSVQLFGAAAMALRTKEYSEATWKWLDKENIGRDVGPGSMPPSRAQIRWYLSKMGKRIESININMDDRHLVHDFLVAAGVSPKKIPDIIDEILKVRKHSTAGCSRATLEEIMDKYHLHKHVEIRGHGHLFIKKIITDPIER